jgi:hypothetical protein
MPITWMLGNYSTSSCSWMMEQRRRSIARPYALGKTPGARELMDLRKRRRLFSDCCVSHCQRKNTASQNTAYGSFLSVASGGIGRTQIIPPIVLCAKSVKIGGNGTAANATSVRGASHCRVMAVEVSATCTIASKSEYVKEQTHTH